MLAVPSSPLVSSVVLLESSSGQNLPGRSTSQRFLRWPGTSCSYLALTHCAKIVAKPWDWVGSHAGQHCLPMSTKASTFWCSARSPKSSMSSTIRGRTVTSPGKTIRVPSQYFDRLLCSPSCWCRIEHRKASAGIAWNIKACRERWQVELVVCDFSLFSVMARDTYLFSPFNLATCCVPPPVASAERQRQSV